MKLDRKARRYLLTGDASAASCVLGRQAKRRALRRLAGVTVTVGALWLPTTASLKIVGGTPGDAYDVTIDPLGGVRVQGGRR